MVYWHSSFRPRSIIVALFALLFMSGQPKAFGQDTSPGIDFFSGLNFSFRDMNFYTQYEYLLQITPGFKWNMGHHWQLAGQAVIPILNHYGDDYKYVQVNALNISKELHIKSLYLKTTAGVFSQNRYGVDLKAFLPLCDWFALEGQAGFVGVMVINPVWWCGSMNTFVWTAGGDIYLSKWNTQFRGVIGKYLFGDFGLEAEAMRHFNHTTVSVYGQWNDIQGFDAGFRFVIALPPYHRTHRKVNIRPASNYRVSYSVMYHPITNSYYHTDPEENERDGWFSRDLLHWGSHTMQPDFIITEKTKKNEKPD